MDKIGVKWKVLQQNGETLSSGSCCSSSSGNLYGRSSTGGGVVEEAESDLHVSECAHGEADAHNEVE